MQIGVTPVELLTTTGDVDVEEAAATPEQVAVGDREPGVASASLHERPSIREAEVFSVFRRVDHTELCNQIEEAARGGVAQYWDLTFWLHDGIIPIPASAGEIEVRWMFTCRSPVF